jgi:type IX secretion system PorP/SprF family membrane protein
MKAILNFMNKIVYTIALIILLQFAGQLNAQQDPQYSMHMLNGMSIHPGYAGSLGGLSANVLYRNQWVGFDGAPKTISANAQLRYFRDQLGTGVSVFNDKIGVFNRSSMNIAQAYHVRLDMLTVSFGLQASLEQFSANLVDVNPVLIGDDKFAGNIAKSIVNFGSGVYVYSDKFWFGASMPHFLKSKWSEVDGSNSYLSNHLFLSTGGVLDLGVAQLKPSMMLKKAGVLDREVDAPFQMEFGCSVYAMSKFGLGFNYRLRDAIIYLAEFQINDNFKLAYGYDQTVSNLRGYSNGTHEILMRYSFNNGGKAISSPRLF